MPQYDNEEIAGSDYKPNFGNGEPRVTVLDGRAVVMYIGRRGGYVARTCSPGGGVHYDTDPIRLGDGCAGAGIRVPAAA